MPLDRRMAFARLCAAAASLGSRGLHTAGSVLFPADCLVCADALERPLAGPLCTSCIAGFPRIEPPYCPRCGIPYPRGVAPGVCGPCRSPRRRFRRARAALVYGDDVRRALHALKFGGRERVASVLGRVAALNLCGPHGLHGYAAVVPVPLSRGRRRARGFNQAERIARVVAPVVGSPLRGRLLMKRGDPPPQAGLSRAGRRRNAHHAYRARVPRALAGASVLLVDDVMTTGATAEAATRALLGAGIGSVDVLTVARVP